MHPAITNFIIIISLCITLQYYFQMNPATSAAKNYQDQFPQLRAFLLTTFIKGLTCLANARYLLELGCLYKTEAGTWPSPPSHCGTWTHRLTPTLAKATLMHIWILHGRWRPQRTFTRPPPLRGLYVCYSLNNAQYYIYMYIHIYIYITIPLSYSTKTIYAHYVYAMYIIKPTFAITGGALNYFGPGFPWHICALLVSSYGFSSAVKSMPLKRV